MLKVGSKVKVVGNLSEMSFKFSGKITTIAEVHRSYYRLDCERNIDGTMPPSGGVWFSEVKHISPKNKPGERCERI